MGWECVLGCCRMGAFVFVKRFRGGFALILGQVGIGRLRVEDEFKVSWLRQRGVVLGWESNLLEGC